MGWVGPAVGNIKLPNGGVRGVYETTEHHKTHRQTDTLSLLSLSLSLVRSSWLGGLVDSAA